MKTVTVSDARSRLADLLEAVQRGEHVTLTDGGVPVAELAPPSARRSQGVRHAVEELRAFQHAHTLGDIAPSELLGQTR